MKKSILLFLFILLAVSVFAKDKKLFEKQTEYSFLGFYESKNLKETDNFKYYIVINEDDFEGGRFLYSIVCNNYDKIKDFLNTMYKAGQGIHMFAFYPSYYSNTDDDLILSYGGTEIDSKNNLFIHQKVYILLD